MTVEPLNSNILTWKIETKTTPPFHSAIRSGCIPAAQMCDSTLCKPLVCTASPSERPWSLPTDGGDSLLIACLIAVGLCFDSLPTVQSKHRFGNQSTSSRSKPCERTGSQDRWLLPCFLLFFSQCSDHPAFHCPSGASQEGILPAVPALENAVCEGLQLTLPPMVQLSASVFPSPALVTLPRFIQGLFLIPFFMELSYASTFCLRRKLSF